MWFLALLSFTACDESELDRGTPEHEGACRPEPGVEHLLAAAVEGAFDEASYVSTYAHADGAGVFAVSLWDEAAYAGTLFSLACVEPVENEPYCSEDPNLGFQGCVQTGCAEDLTPWSRAWYEAGEANALAIDVAGAEGTVVYAAEPVHTWWFVPSEDGRVETYGDFEVSATLVGADNATTDVSHVAAVATGFAEGHPTIELDFRYTDWTVQAAMGGDGVIRGEVWSGDAVVAEVVAGIEDGHHLSISFDWSCGSVPDDRDVEEAIDDIRDLPEPRPS